MSAQLHKKSTVAAVSIVASATMAVAKFVVGVLIGSLALISEALHSSVDVVATVITWMVVRVSDLPADEEHQYGHGKLESLSALGVIAMLFVLAGGILVIGLGTGLYIGANLGAGPRDSLMLGIERHRHGQRH